MKIEVVYSPTSRQVWTHSLELPEGTSAQEALRAMASLWELDWPSLFGGGLNLSPGVWGRSIEWTDVLSDGDRLELCRPLRADPKQARRERFMQQGSRKAGLFQKPSPRKSPRRQSS